MGASINRNIIFISILLLITPISFGFTDSIQIGQTKSYQINNNNYEIKCVNGNPDTQISSYSINGQPGSAMQGDPAWMGNGVILRNLGFSNNQCKFAFGLQTDPELCNECVNKNEKWCKDTGLVRSCQLAGSDNCLKIVDYESCKSPSICLNGQCVIPSGCSNNNPPCNSGYQCVNNQCLPLCTQGNICEGNYVYYQKGDCSKQSIKFCQWGCSNGDCSGAPPGCAYSNPACPPNYNCVNNQCVQQNPTGCAYNNPPCSFGFTCNKYVRRFLHQKSNIC